MTVKATTASKFRLGERQAEKYSPSEERLFSLLPKNGKSIDSTKLMEKFYNGRRQMPVNGRTSMDVSLKRLMLKVQRNKEPFTVVRSKRKGQGPIEWSVQAR